MCHFLYDRTCTICGDPVASTVHLESCCQAQDGRSVLRIYACILADSIRPTELKRRVCSLILRLVSCLSTTATTFAFSNTIDYHYLKAGAFAVAFDAFAMAELCYMCLSEIYRAFFACIVGMFVVRSVHGPVFFRFPISRMSFPCTWIATSMDAEDDVIYRTGTLFSFWWSATSLR